MINTTIKDSSTGNAVKIGEEGELEVVVHPHPPMGESIFPLPFSQFFTDNGLVTGSSDMRVDGSTNFVDFYITAHSDFDLFINSITVQISDPGARLDRFGALTALTNGVKFFYFEQKIGELVISESIKTNLDFFRDATGGKGFGDGTGAWKADIAGGGGEDTYFPEIDLEERFGLQWGLRLVKGTTDSIVFRVQDNLSTGLSTFNIKAYGIRI
jgi:hypothetical protein